MRESNAPAVNPLKKSPWMVWAACGAIVLAGLLAYQDSYHAPFAFDDVGSIQNNPTIQRLWPIWDALNPPNGSRTVSGRPVLNLSFAVNYAISGTDVWSYHALNLVIHLLAGLTLFGIVRRTFEQVGTGGPPVRVRFGFSRSTDGRPARPYLLATSLAFAIALLWTVHPLQTEAVTYVVQRAESLTGLFYLLTLYCSIRYMEAPSSSAKATADKEAGRNLWAVLSILACLFGMATKELMVTAPVLVYLYDRTFVSKRSGPQVPPADGPGPAAWLGPWRRHRGFYLGLAATWILLAGLVAANGGNRGGTIGFGTTVTWPAYVLTQFQAVVRYLELCIWPHPQVFDYGPFWVRSVGQVLPYAIVVLALAAGVLVAVWRGSALGFLGLWFFGILAPTSLAPGTTQMIVEHRLYLPLAAVLVLLVAGIGRVAGRLALPLCLLLAIAGGVLTYERNQVYRGAVSLWGDTVAKRPNNAEAHNNFAVVLAQDGRIDDALREYQRALQILPDFTEAHFNLGVMLFTRGQLDPAIGEFEEAIRLQPDYARAHYNLGLALLQRGRVAEALPHAEKEVALEPDYADGHAGLANALALAGRAPEAIPQYELALRLDPGSAKDHFNLALILESTGHPAEAAEHLAQALRLDPHYAEASYQLGLLAIGGARVPEAAGLFAQAVSEKPDYAEAHLALGNVAMMQGRLDEALASYQRAVQANPRLAEAHFNLGNALAQGGRMAEAVTQYEAALQLKPDFPAARQNLAMARERLRSSSP
jgi:tetratricopeptide (TPR) repeat protein